MYWRLPWLLLKPAVLLVMKIDPCVMLAGAREMGLLGSQISIVEGVGGISARL